MKEKNAYAIDCYPEYGPIFGRNDIVIVDNCNRAQCYIDNEDTMYECHPQFKHSLFVNTHKNDDEILYFTVLDYEVYAHNLLSY